MKPNKIHIAKFVFLLILLGCTNLLGQRVKVPVELQTKIIPKILSLNKSFDFNHDNKYINAIILYNSNQRNSKQVFDDFILKVNGERIRIKNKEVKLHSYDIAKHNNLREFLKSNNINVLYLTPLRGVDINEVVNICKEEKVLTITAVEEYFEKGVAVLINLEQQKLKIVINNKVAKESGAEFSSRLLKIARVVD